MKILNNKYTLVSLFCPICIILLSVVLLHSDITPQNLILLDNTQLSNIYGACSVDGCCDFHPLDPCVDLPETCNAGYGGAEYNSFIIRGCNNTTDMCPTDIRNCVSSGNDCLYVIAYDYDNCWGSSAWTTFRCKNVD